MANPLGTTRTAEIATIIAVGMSIVGSLLFYTAHFTDRIALLEERVSRLQHDNDKFSETSLPVVEARLDRQRADLDDLNKRLEKYCIRDD